MIYATHAIDHTQTERIGAGFFVCAHLVPRLALSHRKVTMVRGLTTLTFIKGDQSAPLATEGRSMGI